MNILVSALLKRIFTGNLESLLNKLSIIEIESPITLMTPNINHLRVINSNESYAITYLSSDYLIVDGVPLLWLNRIFSGRNLDRIGGVDLVESLIRRNANFCVVGSNNSTVRNSLERKGRGNLQVPVHSSTVSKLISLEDYREIKTFLIDSNTRYALLALNTEKQITFLQRLKEDPTPIPLIYVGVGGSFDILSNKFSRAPKFMQKIGLEWFWRACQSPIRLIPRYFFDFLFLAKVFLYSALERCR